MKRSVKKLKMRNNNYNYKSSTKNYNINNITDAFLALNDIDDEEVIGMVKNIKKIDEGVDISLTTSTNDELEDAKNFIRTNEHGDDTEIEVIDANADAIEHVKNNKDYIGQVILCCNRCHSNKFIDMDDLVPSEENPDLYNVDEECPFCKESGFGYKVVGQVGKVEQPNDISDNGDDEKNNIEPSVEENDLENEEDVSFDSEEENNNSADEEASFDNDVENDSEETEEEEINDNEEDDEEATEDDEEEKVEEAFDETSENEDAAEEDEKKSKLGEEFVPEYKLDEEEVSNAFKKAVNLKDGVNGYAEEAWMMNQVISSMNDEEAYYDSWLYIWPDGETREECEYDFGNKEDFEELKEVFIDTYKLYHSDGLYDATEEILAYAHKWDKLLDLAPIENFVVEDMKEEKEFAPEIKFGEKDEETGKPAILVTTLLNLFISSDKFNNIEIDGDVYENIDDISEDILNKKLRAFNTKDSSLVVCTLKPNAEEYKGIESAEVISVIDLLTLFNNDDEEFKKLVIEDAFTSDEIFRGDKVGAIAACADYTVTYLERPEALVITTAPEEEDSDDIEENNIKPLDTNIEDVDETLFEEICRENNLYSYKVNRVGSEEYWLNEDLINEDDLQTVYEKYCRGKKCAQRFKEQFSKYKFIDSTEYLLEETLKKLNESGFTADELSELKELMQKLKMGDSLKNVQDFAKEHGCGNMKEIIAAMKKEIAEIDCDKASKEYSKHPENFKLIDGDKDKGDGQHLLKRPCDDKGAQVSTDGGKNWEECSEEEFDELLDAGYVVVNDVEEDIVPDEEETISEVDENCRSFKTRKELKEAIEECENNNKPYSVKRSNKDGYRFDLLIGEAIEEDVEDSVEEEEVIDEAKNKKASILKWIDTLPTEDPELDLCEDIDNELEIVDSPDTEVVEPDEIIDNTNPDNETTDIVPDNLSEEEINLLGKVNRIANDICEAIYNYYEVEVSPALVVADILQDLKLISRAIDISELEDTPINNLTKQMFQKYEDGYRLVDDIMTTLTGEPFTTLPEDKLREAINSLDGPQFSKENIERMIRSPRFVAAVEQGMIPYIPNGMNHELIESMKKKINENNEGKEIENKLDLYNSDKVLYEVVAPHVVDLIGNPTTLHYDDLNIYTDKVISSANEVEPAEYEEKEVEWDYELNWSVDDDLLPFIEDNYDVDNFTENDLNGFDENEFIEYLKKKYRDEAQEDAQANWEEPDYSDEYDNDDVDESVDVDVDQFDDFVNEYFNENYDQTLLYHTINGNVSDKGKIMLEGVIKGACCEKKVVFTLTPKTNNNISEALNDNDDTAGIQKALGLLDYKVENNLSEEVWEFKFINDIPNEDIFELTEENKIKILKSFLKEVKDIDKHLTPAEVVEEAATWEYERNKPYYNKMGIDVCHIKNKLSEVVDQIDFTPLIENGNPNETEQ